MRLYQLTYLISPKLDQKEIKKIEEELNLAIKNEGGKIREVEFLGRKKLAYQIKKEKEAIFVNLKFNLDPEKIKNLEKNLKAKEKILRYLMIAKKEEKKVELKKPKRIKKEKVELEKLEEKLKEILNESQ
jgi:small subunit ribosomal protein S6